MKKFLFVLIVLAIIAALVFYDQVLDAFRGMTILESIKVIVQFVIHVAVATILTWGLYMVVEILEPLVSLGRKVLRWKRKNFRRAQHGQMAPHGRMPLPAPRRSGRLTAEQLARLMIAMNRSDLTPGPSPKGRGEPQPEERIHLDF